MLGGSLEVISRGPHFTDEDTEAWASVSCRRSHIIKKILQYWTSVRMNILWTDSLEMPAQNQAEAVVYFTYNFPSGIWHYKRKYKARCLIASKWRLGNDKQLFAVFSVGHCVFSKVIVFSLFVSWFPNWELWKQSSKALEWLMANYNIAFLDVSGIVLYLTFPFGMQLNDHNWHISSRLPAQQKAVHGKKKTIPSQILPDSLIFSPSLTSRIYSSHIINDVQEHYRKIRKYFKT